MESSNKYEHSLKRIEKYKVEQIQGDIPYVSSSFLNNGISHYTSQYIRISENNPSFIKKNVLL